MKTSIFISWSGDFSRVLAQEFQSFFKGAIPAKHASVFFSKDDMQFGLPWRDSLRKVLLNSNVAIALLTRDAVRSPWVLFECGAVSKESSSRLYPVLVSVDRNELPSPLEQFQVATTDEPELWRLVQAIAAHVSSKSGWQFNHSKLKTDFGRWFPTFQSRLKENLSKTLHACGNWSLVGSAVLANQISNSPFEARHLFQIAKHQIDLVAQNHHFLTVDKQAEHLAILRDFLRKSSGRTVNILLMNPRQRAPVTAWTDLMSPHFPQDLRNACASLRRWLKIAKKEKWKGKLQVKFTGLVPTSQSFVDGPHPNGLLVLVPMINKPSNLDRPAIMITKQANAVAFNSYWTAHFERFRRAAKFA